MYEVYDKRTNEVVYSNDNKSVCENWIYDMNDFADYNFLFVREVVA